MTDLLARQAARWRWVGFGAAVVLAATSYGSGSRPVRHESILWPGFELWAPRGGSPLATLGSILAMAVLLAAWWLLRPAATQRSLSRRWWWGTAALWFAPLLFAVPLYSRDLYSYAAQGALWGSGLSPYDFGVMYLDSDWVTSTAPTWLDSKTPYGPFWLLLARGSAWASGGNLAVAVGLLRLASALGILVIAWAVWDIARRLGSDPHRATWLAVACPLVGAHFVGGGHNDALMVAGILAGVALALRGRLVAGCAALALGALVKMTAVVVLPFLVLLALVGPGRWAAPRRGWLPVISRGVVAVLVTGAVLAVFSLVTGLGFGWLNALGTAGKNDSWLSLPTAVGYFLAAIGHVAGNTPLINNAVDVTRLVGLALMALVLVLLWLRAAHPPQPSGRADGHDRAGGSTTVHNPVGSAGREKDSDSHMVAGHTVAAQRHVVAHLAWAVSALVVLAPAFLGWYFLWALPLLAVTLPVGWYGPDGKGTRRESWLGGIATALCLLTLPDGYTAALRITGLGVAFMLAATVFGLVRGWRWLRQTRWSRALDLTTPLDSRPPTP